MENDLTLADEMIDAWHSGAGQLLELHEYLGLTFDEYANVFRDPKALDDAVRKAMKALREVHTDYTDRTDEHRMYCLADGQP
jgi:regulator of RNase E activity RraB